MFIIQHNTGKMALPF